MYREQYSAEQITELNKQKYETYRKMYDNLKIAMNRCFYLEAICLEYAIAEDRIDAVFRCFDDKAWNQESSKKTLRRKIKELKENRNYKSDEMFIEKLPEQVLGKIDAWANKRNDYLHHLAYLPYCDDDLRVIAQEGRDLIKDLNNSVKKVKNYFTKKKNAL